MKRSMFSAPCTSSACVDMCGDEALHSVEGDWVMWRFEGKARQLPRVRGLIMWEYEGFEKMGDSSYHWYPSMAVVVS